MPTDTYPHSGIYANEATQSWEAWVVNETTGESHVVSTCSFGLGSQGCAAWIREGLRRVMEADRA